MWRRLLSLAVIAHGLLAPHPLLGARRARRASLRAADDDSAEALQRQAEQLRAEVAAEEEKLNAVIVARTTRLADEAFAELDANRDGVIEPAELRAALARRGVADVSDAMLARVIDEFDENKDGVIQRDEMPSGESPPPAILM